MPRGFKEVTFPPFHRGNIIVYRCIKSCIWLFDQEYGEVMGHGGTNEEDEVEAGISSSDESSGSDLSVFCRYSVSPITSEHSSGSEVDTGDEGGNDNVAQSLNQEEQPVLAVTTFNHGRSPRLTTYRLCGDNIDKTVRARYMRSERGKPESIHYFHSYAALDRIDFSNLSECRLPLPCVSDNKIADSLLPSNDA